MGWFSPSPPPPSSSSSPPTPPPSSPRASLPSPPLPPPSSSSIPSILTASALTAILTLSLTRAYKLYLRRIPNVSHLPPRIFHRRSLYGYVSRVGDGDNFRLFHTPGGKLAGWGWLPGRRPHTLSRKALVARTLHVRLAGVDAPEMAHFGRPGQPHAAEALAWLRKALEGRYVRVRPYRRDQYERVVGTAYYWRMGGWWWKTDVGLAMLKRGLATVYEAKAGSEFGGREEVYRAAERRAREKKVGMWRGEGEEEKVGIVGRLLGRKRRVERVESPREFKTRMANGESGAKGK